MIDPGTLSQDARRMLAVIRLAGGPISANHAAHIAALPDRARIAAATELLIAGLVVGSRRSLVLAHHPESDTPLPQEQAA